MNERQHPTRPWDDRQALAMLANAPAGLPKALLTAQGVRTERLADLVSDGLATAQPERREAAGRAIEGPRFQITDAGRRALATV
jgi:hypothetical protein